MVDNMQMVGGRLLKHIVRCYLRLSENKRAREALKTYLPQQLRNEDFDARFEDQSLKRWLDMLRENISNKDWFKLIVKAF